MSLRLRSMSAKKRNKRAGQPDGMRDLLGERKFPLEKDEYLCAVGANHVNAKLSEPAAGANQIANVLAIIRIQYTFANRQLATPEGKREKNQQAASRRMAVNKGQV